MKIQNNPSNISHLFCIGFLLLFANIPSTSKAQEYGGGVRGTKVLGSCPEDRCATFFDVWCENCAFGDSKTNVWLCDHIMDVIQEYCLNNPNCPIYVQNPYSEDKCTPLS